MLAAAGNILPQRRRSGTTPVSGRKVIVRPRRRPTWHGGTHHAAVSWDFLGTVMESWSSNKAGTVDRKLNTVEYLCLFYGFQRKRSHLKSPLSKTGFQKSGPHAGPMSPGGLQPPSTEKAGVHLLSLQQQGAARLRGSWPADCFSSRWD